MSAFQMTLLVLVGLNLVVVMVLVMAVISLKLDVQRLADRLEQLGTSLFPLVVRNILPAEWEVIRRMQAPHPLTPQELAARLKDIGAVE